MHRGNLKEEGIKEGEMEGLIEMGNTKWKRREKGVEGIERETRKGSGRERKGWMARESEKEKNAGVSKSYCSKPQSWQPCHSGDSTLQFPCTSFLAHHAVLLSAPLRLSTHANSHTHTHTA